MLKLKFLQKYRIKFFDLSIIQRLSSFGEYFSHSFLRQYPDGPKIP